MPPKPKPAIPIEEPPSFIEISSPSPKRVHSGRSFSLRFRTDADPSYFLDPDAFLAIISPPDIAQYTGTTTVKDGYGTVYFKVADDVDDDSTATITLELRPHRSKALDATTEIVVAPLPAGTGTTSGKAPTPNINPIWVSADDEYWRDNGWSHQTVAAVDRSDDSIEIYVSSENRGLSKVLSRAQRRGVHTVDAFKDFYLEHICFHALLADIQRAERPSDGEAPTEVDGEAAGDETSIDAELRRAGETLCGVMEMMFDVIATEAASESD